MHVMYHGPEHQGRNIHLAVKSFIVYQYAVKLIAADEEAEGFALDH